MSRGSQNDPSSAVFVHSWDVCVKPDVAEQRPTGSGYTRLFNASFVTPDLKRNLCSTLNIQSVSGGDGVETLKGYAMIPGHGQKALLWNLINSYHTFSGQPRKLLSGHHSSPPCCKEISVRSDPGTRCTTVVLCKNPSHGSRFMGADLD
ncbi:hypothetical protein EYF80_037752 [Liparis tanakae]|uniref:Uncharacterized protein n=1 Tax=Liparis tanakae TaxID=230148 RepID=A0A4Z2GEU5_9TELE|nr:hypothetical protein EYF80_037752 [Liparis tanakae]